MSRPLYCLAEQGDPCPACGATESGDDPVRGRCQAIHLRPPPEPLVRLVLIDKRTGQVFGETSHAD